MRKQLCATTRRELWRCRGRIRTRHFQPPHLSAMLQRAALTTMTETANMATNKGPLDGLRVLDLTRVLAGPFATMALGDLGADVIKIEHPGRGDDTRHWGPPFIQGEAAYYLCVNRNKRSVAVDFKRPKGLEILRRLAAKSDVFIENFLPGKLESVGLGYQALSELNPGLIYCSITGYGSDGPAAHRPGYDVITQGMYGLMSITGSPSDEGGEPAKTGVAMVDLATGLFAHGAILAALHSRHRTGRGQKVDCSLMETQLACLVNIGQNWLVGATKEAKTWGTAHESIVPYQAFSCKDGKYMVGAGNDKQFEKLANAVGMPQLCNDPRFGTNRDRAQNRKALIGILETYFLTKTRTELDELFEAIGGLPCGPLRNIGEAFQDEQAQHRGMVVKVAHPTIGDLPLAGIPVKYSGTKPSIRSAPPLLGQDTKDVLQSFLKYTAEEVEEMEREKVISCYHARQCSEKSTQFKGR
ncbi:caib baif -transferase family protein c7orf10-like isoform 1 [Nannochloropsis gaditana]|uniref:Caib baif-transferase family protein c7orf10-like isoform 1 n=1 Tax=Nannochloropsis gaditana TaxID=72520 RepID=W7U0N6_9STRA|nr:caib baif -transferase family protein c7orf10-like isoform 1 [Nannochloropsis gaditana]